MLGDGFSPEFIANSDLPLILDLVAAKVRLSERKEKARKEAELRAARDEGSNKVSYTKRRSGSR